VTSTDFLTELLVVMAEASFAAAGAPVFYDLCDQSDTCANAIDALLHSCEGTNDPAMKLLVPLMEQPTCNLNPTRFASMSVKIEANRCQAGYTMPETREECADAWCDFAHFARFLPRFWLTFASSLAQCGSFGVTGGSAGGIVSVSSTISFDLPSIFLLEFLRE